MVVPTFSGGLWRKSFSVTIQMKAIEQYFPIPVARLMFIMLYMAVLNIESVDEIIKVWSFK